MGAPGVAVRQRLYDSKHGDSKHGDSRPIQQRQQPLDAVAVALTVVDGLVLGGAHDPDVGTAAYLAWPDARGQPLRQDRGADQHRRAISRGLAAPDLRAARRQRGHE